ncbi:MAG: hypothetical protein AAB071_02685, partial [Bacteroidota bacterium]
MSNIKSARTSLTIIVILFTFSLSYGQYNNTVISDAAKDQCETVITVNPLRPNEMLAGWSDYRKEIFPLEPYFAFSTDGGKNWSSGLLEIFGDIYTRGSTPSVAFDRHGTAFYTCSAINTDPQNREQSIYVSRTDNFGFEWHHTRLPSIFNSEQEKPYIAIDNTGSNYDGNIYVSWTDFKSAGNITSKILFSYSNNGGISFSNPIELGFIDETIGTACSLMPTLNPPQTHDFFGHFVQSSMTAIAPNGDVYVVWWNADFGDVSQSRWDNSTLKLRKSTNGGIDWTPPINEEPKVVSDNVNVPFTRYYYLAAGRYKITSYPVIACDPLNENNIYVAYTSGISETDITPRIMWIRSIDKGDNWSQPIPIGEIGDAGAEFFPAITVEPSGRITIEYIHSYSYPSYPDPGDYFVDTYITTSVNNGESFLPPVKVSKNISDANIGSNVGFFYQGCSSVQGTIFPIWADFSNEDPQMRPDVYFSPITMVDDVSPDTWSDNVYV